jgi:hypothetical protein
VKTEEVEEAEEPHNPSVETDGKRYEGAIWSARIPGCGPSPEAIAAGDRRHAYSQRD